MSQTERLYKIRHLLTAGRCLEREWLLAEFEISPATLKRDLAHLRDRMNMPIVFDRDRGGWRLDATQPNVGTQYELPGLWLTAEEIHALLTMQHLLGQIDAGGLLGQQLATLADRLTTILGDGTGHASDLARRIRIQTVGSRKVRLPHFQAIGSALLRRQRLAIEYFARGRNQDSKREVSPQRLVHYRDNWYLDAWCHLRRGLRSFSVDAVKAVHVVDKPAIEVSDSEVDAALGSAYGIFSGMDVKWARLRFSAERARWVAAETWHPRQRGRFGADGSWTLEVPYADARELVMDILRHVPEVQVLEPSDLVAEVVTRLRQGLEIHNPRLTQ
jgi:predicted DNA-binding transcriptional regulator YafY